jgi:hypothetical protein
MNCAHFPARVKNGTWSWHSSPDLGIVSCACCGEPDLYLNKTSSMFPLCHISGRYRSTTGHTFTTAYFKILIECIQKVAVYLGYGTKIWLSELKLPLKCAVVSLYSAIKQRLKCNTGKVCNYLIQFLLTMVLWTSLPTPFVNAQQLSKCSVQSLILTQNAKYFPKI